MARKTDPRIGTDTDSGREWPAVSLSGRPYNRPARVRHIGKGRIVVLDIGLSHEDAERLISELGTTQTVHEVVDES